MKTLKLPIVLSCLGIIAIVLEIWAKAWAHQTLAEVGAIQLLPNIVDFQFHQNFGVIANIPIPHSIVLPLTLAIVLACGYWLIQSLQATHYLHASALFLLILGALGNFADRIIHGYTTDYLLLFGRSVVNISDALIVLSVLILIWQGSPRQNPSRN